MKHQRVRTTAGLLIALTLATAAASGQAQQGRNPSAAELVEQFKSTKVFWQQFEVAKQIVAFHDKSVLRELEGWLDKDDRHVRGNAAFVLASLGDDRGFNVIVAMIYDRSDRPEGQGMSVISSDGRYHVARQIVADRYYAVHLLGELKDARAVPVLIPLLKDKELNYKVPWALEQIGDRSADWPLVGALRDEDPSVRVFSAQALAKLGATEAVPYLRALLNDREKSRLGDPVTVAEAAKAAIVELEGKP
jgi:HEAT repeat protein